MNQKFHNGRILNIRATEGKEVNQKEFPFVFDEIIRLQNNSLNLLEKEAREFMSEHLNRLPGNSRYDFFQQLHADEILTTNFDYRIEVAFSADWLEKKISPISTETKYSLFRYQTSSNRNIWHIHGEQAMKTSLMLGYNHYIDYAARVRTQALEFFGRLKPTNPNPKMSWVNMFFTHDVYIVGQGMSFCEYPLWWLLAYRHKKLHESEGREKIYGSITYITKSSKHRNERQKNLFDALRSYGVLIREVNAETYDEFYFLVLTNQWHSSSKLI